MIQPSFATMLCFVQTDAVLSAETADLLLSVCVQRSFDRISVDGQLSTNDTAILQASGASGVVVEPESDGERAFGEALDALLRELALAIVRDGEGSERIGRVVVRGGHAASVERTARAIANSPLVKTALHGGDPNWGRIVQAAGMAVVDAAPLTDRRRDRGRAGLRRRSGDRPRRGAISPRACAVPRSSTSSGSPATASRPRSSSATSGTSTSGSTPNTRREDMTPLQPHGDIATLLEALPYIREFHGRTIVVKYGGAAMEDPSLREEFARDIVLLKYVGMNPVVVHGGGPEITSYMERLGLPVEFRGGLRVTSAEAIDVVKMVLVGKVNADIVTRIGRHGQAAVGLSGEDGDMLRVSRRTAPDGSDVGFVGKIERVDVDVINHVAQDYIPVIASIGCDRDGQSHNVNADEVAGAVARALGAYKVLFLTDVEGWLRDPADDALARQRGDRRRGPGRARGHLRRHAPEARRVRGGDPRRRQQRAHRRRPRPALDPARAVHGRGLRDEGPAVAMSLEHLQELDAAHVIGTYARLPLEIVRGEGTGVWDDRGREYLDLLCGISVTNLGHCHPAVVAAVREQAGTLIHASNLFYTEPGLLLAERLSTSAPSAAASSSATRARRPTRRR